MQKFNIFNVNFFFVFMLDLKTKADMSGLNSFIQIFFSVVNVLQKFCERIPSPVLELKSHDQAYNSILFILKF